jgi:hypothetical protein
MMNAHTPHYMNEHQSDLRGIKDGWYAVDEGGKVAFGPFSNRENCLTRIGQLVSWTKSSELRRRTTGRLFLCRTA